MDYDHMSREELVSELTASRAKEEKLHQYESIMSSSSDMTALLDKNFTYLTVNRAYLAAFGKAQDEVVGHAVSEVFGKEFFESVIRPHAEPCMGGKDVSYCVWLDLPVHGRRYMNVVYSPYLGPNGEVRGFVVVARDITESKKAGDDFENIFNLSSDMICVATERGGFLRVSPSCERILGYNVDEILKLDWSELVHPDDVESTQTKVAEQLEGRNTTNFVNRYRCKDGSYKALEWQATFSESGNVYGVARDITERLRSESQLREASVYLDAITKEERERLRRDLHDSIQQQLMAMGLLAAVVRRELSETDPKVACHAAEIEEVANDASRTVEQIAKGLEPLAEEPDALVMALRELASRIKDRHGIQCRYTSRKPVLIENADAAHQLFFIAHKISQYVATAIC